MEETKIQQHKYPLVVHVRSQKNVKINAPSTLLLIAKKSSFFFEKFSKRD